MLLTRSFRLMMSVIPFEANSFEFSKLIFSRAPTLSQALFGTKLLIDLAPVEDGVSQLHKLTVLWLIKNKELILCNFSRLTLALVSETVKFARESNEHKVLTLVLVKAIAVVNSLAANLVACREFLGDDDAEIIAGIKDISHLPRIKPDSKLTLETYISPAIDGFLSKEVIRLHNLLKDIC